MYLQSTSRSSRARWFELNFGYQALTCFVEHQILSMWKKIRGENHRHFRRFNDLEEARVNPPTRLVNRMEDSHFLCDHYMTFQFQKPSRVNKAARAQQPYNHKSPTYKPNPSQANERAGSLVQDLDSVLKETTYLLTLKRVGVKSILHPMSRTIYSVLPLKWEAYWVNVTKLPSLMQI
ncbi:CACTA en-spm transposon protein [Cucumis melo var. makuwa]|uniref:CACTA en-spm transposon protein n=1 Tax=Cucumis melo var. makuwa TaxID=1194695 RepID=A0A5D3BLQ5_CUCMM|nr:CACTA en-spm transposon protein [Cucumis melo var. makuwa]TYK00751.1 CACTA en-spm transposon protein [Cucumis melo var. makuwa]